MGVWESIIRYEPAPELISEVKARVAALQERRERAMAYLDDRAVPEAEKDRKALVYSVEIHGPLAMYMELMKRFDGEEKG